MRGSARDAPSQGQRSTIDVLDENWDIVQAYTLCGWTVTQLTIAGPQGMPLTIPHYLGITATEMQAAVDALQIPAAMRADTFRGIQFMAQKAAKVLNDRSRSRR